MFLGLVKFSVNKCSTVAEKLRAFVLLVTVSYEYSLLICDVMLIILN